MARILVIDDNEDFRKTIRKILEQEGYEVCEAANGNLGIEQYHRQPADLVITDMIMPEKEGLETMMELRRDFPGVKVFAISGGGFETPENYLDGARLIGGALRTFTKPFPLQDLLLAIKEVLTDQ